MRTCWEHEQEKLKLIVGDEEKIKQKLLEIYRRTDR